MVKQIKSTISNLKLVSHPYIAQLREVMANKKRIFIILEYVQGGEFFDEIKHHGRLREDEARKYFQHTVDAADNCNSRNVYHQDLKIENLLLDDQGNLKIYDFRLNTLPQRVGVDGLLHTTCGTPNYVALEVIKNEGHHGSTPNLWSCGVILFILMVGYSPFDDTSEVALFKKIMRSGARKFIKRILDPNLKTCMTVAHVYHDKWFKKGYKPAKFTKEDVHVNGHDDAESIFSNKVEDMATEVGHHHPHVIMSGSELINHLQACNFNLSPLFETKEDTIFKSMKPCKDIMSVIESIAKPLGSHVCTHDHKMKLERDKVGRKCHLSIAMEVIEVAPCIHMVELQKKCGDTLEHQTFYNDMVGKGLKDIVFKSTVGAWKCILEK